MKSNYSVLIVWSEEDKAFLASVPELPGCIADGSTREEAVRNLDVVIEEWIETAKELKRQIPAPIDHATQEAMAERFRSDVKQHIQREVQTAVERVLSELSRLPSFAGHSDPGEWWKRC